MAQYAVTLNDNYGFAKVVDRFLLSPSGTYVYGSPTKNSEIPSFQLDDLINTLNGVSPTTYTMARLRNMTANDLLFANRIVNAPVISPF